ncbi:MAG: MATE family efflux transporter [Candidatus Riflebacteria bacterium]
MKSTRNSSDDNALKKMKSLTRFSGPILAELLLSFAVNMLLFSLLGKIADAASGAVGVVNSLFWLFQTMFLGLSQAGSILIARVTGNGLENDAARLRGALLGLFFVIATVMITVFSYGRHFFITTVLGLQGDSALYAIDYCRIAQWSLALTAIGQYFTSIFRSAGNSLLPLLAALCNHSVCFICLWLMPAEILGLQFSSIERVAVSQFSGNLTAIIIAAGFFIYLLKLPLRFPGDYTGLLIEAKPIIGLAAMVVLEPFAYALSQLFIGRMFADLGAVALAARAYSGTLSAVPSLPGIALGWGAQVQVSFLIGAGKREEARKMVLRSSLITFLVGPTASTMVYMLSPGLLSLFTADQEVISAARSMLAVYILLEAGRGLNTTLAPSLKARGEAKFVARIAFFIMLFICVPLAWVLAFHFGLGAIGLALALAFDELLRGLINLWRWASSDKNQNGPECSCTTLSQNCNNSGKSLPKAGSLAK